MRKAYLDNIRWVTVFLVLIYHVIYLFNGLGIPGGIPNAANIPALDTISYIVYPWFMVLLFLISGISARYALQTRTSKQFIMERARKLLVPATLGLFVIHWITGYLNIKIGGGLEYMPPALIYPISVISGIGPLWFIQMLFLFSCLLLLLRKLDKQDKLWTLCGKANLPVILLLFFVVFGASQILNMPLLTMYRFGIYFVAFLIGYYIFSHEVIQDLTQKICLPMLVAAVIGAVCYTIYYYGSDYTSPACLQSFWTNLYLWVVILAILGCFKRWFNFETPVSRYMSKASFGLYILHYPVLLAICYLLHTYTSLPVWCNYVIALVTETIVTFAAHEIIKRIPLIRYLVLGIKNTK